MCLSGIERRKYLALQAFDIAVKANPSELKCAMEILENRLKYSEALVNPEKENKGCNNACCHCPRE
jgi:hypothetical protein